MTLYLAVELNKNFLWVFFYIISSSSSCEVWKCDGVHVILGSWSSDGDVVKTISRSHLVPIIFRLFGFFLLHHDPSSLLITLGPSSSSELGKWINMKFLIFLFKIHAYYEFVSLCDWNHWMAEMMSIKDFIFFFLAL